MEKCSSFKKAFPKNKFKVIKHNHEEAKEGFIYTSEHLIRHESMINGRTLQSTCTDKEYLVDHYPYWVRPTTCINTQEVDYIIVPIVSKYLKSLKGGKDG